MTKFAEAGWPWAPHEKTAATSMRHVAWGRLMLNRFVVPPTAAEPMSDPFWKPES